MTDFAIRLGRDIMPMFGSAPRCGIFCSPSCLRCRAIPPMSIREVFCQGRLEAGSVRGRARQSGRMLVQPRIAAEDGTRLDEIIGPVGLSIGAGVDPRGSRHRDDCALMEKLGATFTLCRGTGPSSRWEKAVLLLFVPTASSLRCFLSIRQAPAFAGSPPPSPFWKDQRP
jgi:hypothetical protein